MKIALTTGGFVGGVATALHELALALQEQGHSVLIATMWDSKSECGLSEESGVAVHRFYDEFLDAPAIYQFPGIRFFPYFYQRAYGIHKQTAALFADFKPDIIDCADQSVPFFALDNKFPVVFRCYGLGCIELPIDHSQSSSECDRHLVSAFEFMAARSADAIITPSQSVSNLFKDHGAFPLECIDVVPNILSEAFLAHYCTSDISSKENNANDTANPVLLFFGRLMPIKGCDLIIEALPAVRQRYGNVRLLIAGGHEQRVEGVASYVDTMKERISQLGLSECVSFLGIVQSADLIPLIRQATICIFPSRYDCAPYACMEAMAYGGTILASAVGGIPEYISHGTTGWLTPPEDSSALSEAILTLLDDEELRNRLRIQAHAVVRERYVGASAVAKLMKVYEKANERFKHRQWSKDPVLQGGAELFNQAFLDFCKTDYAIANLTATYSAGARAAWDEAYAKGLADGLSQSQVPKSKRLVSKIKNIARTILSSTQ